MKDSNLPKLRYLFLCSLISFGAGLVLGQEIDRALSCKAVGVNVEVCK